MPPDTPKTSNSAAPVPRPKYRVRFRKAGDLRFVSHHDLMHVFERMFRRADLEVPVTQGFNPRPRIWFALSLALGIAGLREIVEFELVESLPIDEVTRRLTRQCPPGLELFDLRAIESRMAARVRRAWYGLEAIGAAHTDQGAAHGESGAAPLPLTSCAALQCRIDEFLARPHHFVQRTRPHPKRMDVRPYVSELHMRGGRIEMALWITPNGAARPEEIAAGLGLRAWLDDGGVIERTDLEVYDELPPGIDGPPPMQAAEEITANEPVPEIAARPTAIISSPMSFDS
jgi:radical SAM-linked protein